MIRIGYHGEMFKKDLAEILKEFRLRNPKTKVYLSQEPQDELIGSLEAGELDLVFTIRKLLPVPGLDGDGDPGGEQGEAGGVQRSSPP